MDIFHIALGAFVFLVFAALVFKTLSRKSLSQMLPEIRLAIGLYFASQALEGLEFILKGLN